jgi:hypothetical protein
MIPPDQVYEWLKAAGAFIGLAMPPVLAYGRLMRRLGHQDGVLHRQNDALRYLIRTNRTIATSLGSEPPPGPRLDTHEDFDDITKT